MRTLLWVRIGLVLAVFGFSTPVGLAGPEVMIATAGPLIVLRTGVPLGWSIRVWNSSDATYSVLYVINGDVERKSLPPRKRKNIGYVRGREVPVFRLAGIRRVERYDLWSEGSRVWPFRL